MNFNFIITPFYLSNMTFYLIITNFYLIITICVSCNFHFLPCNYDFYLVITIWESRYNDLLSRYHTSFITLFRPPPHDYDFLSHYYEFYNVITTPHNYDFLSRYYEFYHVITNPPPPIINTFSSRYYNFLFLYFFCHESLPS